MADVALLVQAYKPLLELAEGLVGGAEGEEDQERGWVSTLLPGWTVRDLVLHLAGHSQRGLVALNTPSPEPADTDEASYWSHWRPGSEAAEAGLRRTRIMASAWCSVRGPAELFLQTAQAVLTAGSRVEGDQVVLTHGHRITADALLHTLAVEAAVHHLDLEPVLPHAPAPSVLQEVRRVLDALLGEPAPSDWDDVRYARTGTGRLPLDEREREQLGVRAEAFPLFG